MTYKIPILKNFSFQEYLWFLVRNYDNYLHEVRPDAVRKAILLMRFQLYLKLRKAIIN